MTPAADRPPADSRLERDYRRLLLAYPRGYRRRHGTEILTTLLDMAEPGQQRPSAADAWHLLVSGMRQRFRIPTRRPLAVCAAVLATAILAGLGAALGSLAGRLMLADVPSADAARALAVEIATIDDHVLVNNSARLWSSWHGFVVEGRLPDDWSAERARARLTAQGWTTSAVEVTSPPPLGSDPDRRDAAFTATRAGINLRVDGARIDDGGSFFVSGEPAVNAAYLPLVVAGTVLGAVAGWLLAASGADRLHRHTPARRTIGVSLSTTALLSLIVPGGVLLAALAHTLTARATGDQADDIYSLYTYATGSYYLLPYRLLRLLTITGLILGFGALVAWTPVPPDQRITAAAADRSR
jgi:hypothetical protein